MADMTFVQGFDPYGFADTESARLEAFLRSLSGDDWNAPSGCSKWNRFELLCHLAGTEVYDAACLAGTVAGLLTQLMEAGVTDVGGANTHLMEPFLEMQPDDVFDTWVVGSAATRAGFRQRADGMVDSSVGEYPARQQAFHIAAEVATHGDDMGTPDRDEPSRVAWLAAFSRFSLAEQNESLTIEAVDGGTSIVGEGVEITLDDRTFIDAVSGRAGDVVTADVTALLSTMP
jgi:uncharacterized protein (TIGR03083 family)